MKKVISIKLFGGLMALLVLASCAKKLDLFPQNDLTPEKTFATPEGYKAVLAKIYGTLSITGNAGPAGAPDIAGGFRQDARSSSSEKGDSAIWRSRGSKVGIAPEEVRHHEVSSENVSPWGSSSV